MDSKHWFASKTLWLNILAAAALVIQSFTGFVVSPEVQGAILILLNVILRLVTKSEIVW